ncbi:hypothetical protein TVAG_478930 [Trichomonas vaginalis G3]|uniref:RRM domain-containing protein n=1 Tax=Trichomonas vaginalis (strain ATCC PRA-98 / G3) TaxID=412133 RepID=A2E009_TRIV3|nr:RNA-binding domain, RBD family-containing protein [Trichomonas vaginalis G3]EAY14068.1 hypothetical protein TVAG_478930 [Trichomonas vaginalis G3]KAI5519491.1 RNA-binding domain, RBD family-containing protein [Trichomonas vaginalis G3]|eukprot:XP_001326291.1 hypothetical protein [Trichomonas vaginalis G3]
MDPNIATFLVEYYETLHNNSREVNNVYVDGARLIIFQGIDQPKAFVSDYAKYIPIGKRKILKYSGSTIGSRLFVHVQSEIEQPYNKLIVDESFSCVLSDVSIMISYHSIHINPLLEPIAVLPPPKPKIITVVKPKPVEVKPAVEVELPQALNTKNSVIVQNLPFNKPPAEFIPILEKFGHVSKFCQAKGKLMAEFSNIDDMFKARDAVYKDWNGRTPKVFRCPREYKWP